MGMKTSALATLAAGVFASADAGAADGSLLRDPFWKDNGIAAYLPKIEPDVPWLRMLPQSWPEADRMEREDIARWASSDVGNLPWNPKPYASSGGGAADNHPFAGM